MFRLFLNTATNNPDRVEAGKDGEWDITRSWLKDVEGTLSDAKQIAHEIELSLDSETNAGIDIFNMEGHWIA
jgi:hypothetical protein|tara:strand:+ start:121 stop:336 length:216 start_codon:yes stop_codon:yes gene_type:complete